MPYRVCFVSAEYTPLAKTGGLADVSTALTRYLHRQGHDVRPFVPLYRRIAERREPRWPVEFLQGLTMTIGGRELRWSVSTGPAPGSDLMLYYVECPALYDRPGIYTADPDEHVRFLFLTRAAIEACQRMGFAPDVLHCNDWHTGFGPLLLRTRYSWDRLFAGTKTVLTIHNVGYQGTFGAERIGDLDLGDATWLLHQQDLATGRINSMKHGVMYADLVTTVSPTYAEEISTPEFGFGMDPYLRARGDRLVGILNGVDYDDWNPATDRYLPVKYSPEDLSGKAELQRRLLARLRIPAGPRSMTIGLVSRLVGQKGIDLLPEGLTDLLRTRDVRFVALGSGERRYEEYLEWLQRAFPDKVVFHNGYSDELAHWIEAASDTFLMPSLYEPCGLNQMYSLKYGTPPIVRRTGGLADSVQMFRPSTGEGTGILFDHYDAAGVRWALDTALALHADEGTWRRMMLNGMAQDFSWERQGALYLEQYARIGAVERLP
jgi:starch synthase